MLFDGSDDELGMEDEEPFDDEPPFEPLEVDDDLELGKIIVDTYIHILKIIYASLCIFITCQKCVHVQMPAFTAKNPAEI